VVLAILHKIDAMDHGCMTSWRASIGRCMASAVEIIRDRDEWSRDASLLP